MSSLLHIEPAVTGAAERARSLAAGAMRRLRIDNTYWHGDLTADSTLESDFILLQLWLYPPENGVWNPPTRPLIDKAVRSILARQLPKGGFNIYSHGPEEISASVKAYFALKVAGLPPEDERMARCRERILAMGGLQSANSYVKLNLSLFNLYPRDRTPSVPPEMMLLGRLIYEMSSWTRAIVIPLSIVHSANPQRPVPAGFHLRELFHPERPTRFLPDRFRISWRNLFLLADRFFKFWEKYGSKSIRRRATRKAAEWMIDHFRDSDGLGAIYPSMMYAVMAMDVLGYPRNHPLSEEARRQFDNLLVERGEKFFFVPCYSPVWDTAIAAFAVTESGLFTREEMRPTADWLLDKEVRKKGDWSIKRPHVEPSGWYFEFANEFYPDIDDTAMVLLALKNMQATDPGRQAAAVQRAVNWLLAMQSKDGGWAAFDVDNTWTPLSYVPFADHNAMLDPTCPDITGRVLEALIAHGVPREHPAIRKGVSYLLASQQANGSWFGRWGVNYIYGTFLALRGLRAAGVSDREAAILRAGEWLRSVQNPDGGWGEDCLSYATNEYVSAGSTASQTAWAVLGLLAGGDDQSLSLQAGIQFLSETQRPDGTWEEDLSTGTGFPKVFYLTYHLYRQYFPLLALSAFLKSQQQVNRPS